MARRGGELLIDCSWKLRAGGCIEVRCGQNLPTRVCCSAVVGEEGEFGGSCTVREFESVVIFGLMMMENESSWS